MVNINVPYHEKIGKKGGYIFVQNGEQLVKNPVLWTPNLLTSQTRQLEIFFRQLHISPKDRVLNLLQPGIEGTYFVFNLALENIQSTIIPLGKSEMEVALRFIIDLNVSVILGESKYLIELFQYIDKKGIAIQIERVFIIGSILSINQRKFLEKFSKKVYSSIIFDITNGIIATICPEKTNGYYHIIPIKSFDENGISNNSNPQYYRNKSLDVDSIKKSLCQLTLKTGLNFTQEHQSSCECGNRNPLIKVMRAGNGKSNSDKMEYLIWKAQCV
jgi:hypothetical protein